MALLSVSHLKKSFGGVHAVRDVSLSIEKGSITALIGPNGAGKTSVFGLISGMLAPDQGDIRLGDTDLTKLTAWQRSRAGLARTFQLARTFKNLSVEENLLLSLRQDDDNLFKMFLRGPGITKEEREKVRGTLHFVGLTKDPTSPVTDLSYGQQKLFDLARAMLNPHTLLMLDEPVAGVNPVLRDQLAELLLSMKEEGETTLLIEHDMGFVRRVADRVIVLAEGTVIAEGTPEEVFSHAKVLEAYLGVPVT